MVEEDYDLVPYKDISDLKKELEGMRGRKDVSTKELYDAVQRLAQTITDMLQIFGAAAEQMRLEEKEIESEARRFELIMSKLDKITEKNKIIAEGLVAIVDMIKEKMSAPEHEEQKPEIQSYQVKEEPLSKPVPEPTPFTRPSPPQWQPMQEPKIPAPQQYINPPPQLQPMESMPQPPGFDMPEFNQQMPPLEPMPSPDLDFPEEVLPFDEEQQPKKRGLFGLFKK